MKRIFLFLAATISLLTSCIEEDFVDDLVLVDPKLKITTGSPLGQDSLFVRDTMIYTAEYINNVGQVEDVNFTWTSSDDAVANVDENGRVIALSKGVTNLTVFAQGLSLERLLIIDELERVVIQAPSSSLLVGEEINFSASYYNRVGTLSPASFTWMSSDLAVASINSASKLTGIKSGQTSITANTNGITSRALLITIVDDTNSVASIDISTTVNSVIVGESIPFTAIVKNINGNAIMNQTISWASNNSSTLTIDNNGLATGLNPGIVAITASTDGISSNSISITVANDTNSVTSIDISTTSTSITVGETLSFTAIAKNINGNSLLNEPINWASSNLSVLSIDNNGLATGISPGASNITASSGTVTSPAINLVVKQQVVTSKTGSFKGRGSYKVSGDVTMTVQSTGSLKLEFASNFSTSNGPGLYVYLSNTTSGGLDIGKLPKTSGSFTLFPPTNVGISDYKYVLIWCKPFGLTFGEAELK